MIIPCAIVIYLDLHSGSEYKGVLSAAITASIYFVIILGLVISWIGKKKRF